MSARTDWLPSGVQGTLGNDMSTNNSSAFSALPKPYRTYDGYFYGLSSTVIYWWSTTENSALYAFIRRLFYDHDYLDKEAYPKKCGRSVRLVKD